MTHRQNYIGAGLAILMASLTVLTMATAPLVAGAAQQNSELNWSSDAAQDVYVYDPTTTVAEHDKTEMDSPLDYYNDNGEVATMEATLNQSFDNQLRMRADRIDDPDLEEFPRKDAESGDNSASALDGSEWTVGGANSSKASVSDTTPQGMNAVQLSTDGNMGSGDVATFTYSNFSITSDAEKRVGMFIGNVDTLDSGATVHIRFVESDGDYKEVNISSSQNADAKDVAANATASGVVYQQRLADLATEGSGDGSFDAIDKIVVRVEDADATIELTGFDAERKSELTLAEYQADTDGDDELETHQWTEDTDGGYHKVASLSSMGSTFDDATIHQLKVKGVEYRSSRRDASAVHVNFTEASSYPSYGWQLELHLETKAPSAIDLQHSNNMEVRAEQSLVESRYIAFGYAEAVGDTAPEDVSFTDKSGSLANEGDSITIDSSVTAGENEMARVVVLLTSDQKSSLENTGGAAGQFSEDSSGGFIGSIWSWILGLLGMIGGAKLLRR